MKLQGASVILFLGVVGLAKITSGFCLITNTIKPKVYLYHCFKSTDYLADVQAAPIDIPGLTFSRAKMQVLRNKSFTRLSRELETFEINLSVIGEIEDNAFEGLGNLRAFSIIDCNLRTVKGAWFEGLSKLKTISFRGNEIKRIEDNFFSIVPPLDALDVTANELSCLPMNSLESFKTKLLKFRHNPISWGCVSSLWNWAEKTGTEYADFGKGYWDPSSELVLECEKKLRKLRKEFSEENMVECAEKTIADLLLYEEHYTVNQLCQFLKNKSSPFLICS